MVASWAEIFRENDLEKSSFLREIVPQGTAASGRLLFLTFLAALKFTNIIKMAVL